ncbi:MAG TPA: metallophosphoesterase [Oscillatoriaceae cyanobacterium]
MRRAALLAIAVALTGAARAPEGLPPTAPYLQNGTPGGVTLVWRDADPKPATVVLTDDWGHQAAQKRVTAAPQQEVTLSGLTPGEVYRYRVVEQGRVLGSGRFRNNRPAGADHMRFAVIGDMGEGRAVQFALARQLTDWRPEFVLAVGDIIYPEGEGTLYGDRFFGPYDALMHEAIFYPALGNHDVLTGNGAPYLAAFALPRSPGNERYYAFDWGPARFWCLDSTQSLAPNSPQYRWFRADADASGARWKFAFFHHPVYSSGFHGSTWSLRHYLEPIFAHDHFAVVFSGHDHDYERTKPQHGVTYVVTGGGGATVYGMWGPSRFTAAESLRHHFVGVSLYHDTLALQAVDPQGEVFDAAVLRRPAD